MILQKAICQSMPLVFVGRCLLTWQTNSQLQHSQNAMLTHGLVDHFHRHLKAALKARLKDANWLDVLPSVLLGICTVPKDLHTLSAKLVYGAPFTVPGDFITVPHAPVSFPRLRIAGLKKWLLFGCSPHLNFL